MSCVFATQLRRQQFNSGRLRTPVKILKNTAHHLGSLFHYILGKKNNLPFSYLSPRDLSDECFNNRARLWTNRQKVIELFL